MQRTLKPLLPVMCALVCHVPALASDLAGVEADRRAYRLCLARAVTGAEDRFSPPTSIVDAVRPYCSKERSVLWAMSQARIGGDGDNETAAAESWAASYVVAIRSCNSGACELLEAMQRDDLGL